MATDTTPEPGFDADGYPLDYDGVFAALCHAAGTARALGAVKLAATLDSLIESYQQETGMPIETETRIATLERELQETLEAINRKRQEIDALARDVTHAAGEIRREHDAMRTLIHTAFYRAIRLTSELSCVGRTLAAVDDEEMPF